MTDVATARRPQAVKPSGFLPEVQALRAVAVLVVVIYHLWPGRVSGGFVGVDVFFAISGFLITQHLLKNLADHGRVPLLRFWANRIWRLLPAALIVLAVCWIFTLFAAPVSTASNAFKQIAAAGAYVVNWVLAIDSVDYLARDNDPTIAQHYWSLSVEEQFYVAWPLLIMAVVAIASAVGRRGRGDAKAWILGATATIVAVSFAYSVVTTHYLPARAYFDTFARAWEFAIGALLAVVVLQFPGAVRRFRAHRVVSRMAIPQMLGLGLIVGSAVGMDSSTPFPSGWAAVPVLGAALVMLAGAPQRGWYTALVSWRPAQFTGDVSYSLYLWHWPLIIGFSTLAGRRHSFAEGVVLLAAGFVLAWLTKVLIEDPGRKRGRRTARVRPAFLLAVVGASALVIASVAVVNVRSAQADAAAAEQLQELQDPDGCVGANATLGSSECADPFALSAGADPVRPDKDLDPEWCLTWFDQDWLSCEFGDKEGGAGTVAIVGDSHAAALTNPFGEYLESRGWRLVSFTRFGCPGLSQTSIGLRAQTPATEQACATWSERVLEELTSRTDIDTVVFTSFESAYAQPETPGAAQLTATSIEHTLGTVAASGKDVVLLRDFAASHGSDVPTCVASSDDPASDCSVPHATAYPPGPFDPALASLGGGVRVVDPRDATCDDERCYAVVGDVVVYADDNHVSRTFARSLMRYLGPALIDGSALSRSAQR